MALGVRLVVFDMEGTLTTDPTVWELMHLKVGTWESHGRPYWERYKAGEIHYDEFARMDVATWKGAAEELLEAAVREVPLMPGCADLMRFLDARGVRTAIVSNGLERLGLRLAREFGVGSIVANREVVRNGRLTGELELLAPFGAKGDALRRIAAEMGIRKPQVMAVGDGPADVEMFREAGVSVAFAPQHDDVAVEADHHLTKPDLRLLMPLFG